MGAAHWAKKRFKRALTPAVRSFAATGAVDFNARGLDASSAGLEWGGVSLDALTQTFGSPLHVVNRGRVEANARAFQAVPPGRKTRCEVYFSYKTNPVPGVLRLLHENGVGAEVISEFELDLALKLGVTPARIVYNGPVKSDASIKKAMSLEIGLIVANHREELARLASLAASLKLKQRPRVGIRVSPSAGWSGQFGTPIAGGQALAAFEEARGLAQLDVVGLHAHRGGMIRDASEVTAFVSEMLAFTDELAARGFSLDILDFGGSLASPLVRYLTKPEQRLSITFGRVPNAPKLGDNLSIAEYLALVVEMVETHYQRAGRPQPRIFMEPGRAMVGDCQVLLATVQAIKRGDERTFAILDAGINHADSVRTEVHPLVSVRKPAELGSHLYTVVGPICSPGDTLYPAALLPELQPGDVVAMLDTGAYCVPFSTSFSFPKPGIVEVHNGQTRQLRRPETFEDLTRLDVDVSG